MQTDSKDCNTLQIYHAKLNTQSIARNLLKVCNILPANFKCQVKIARNINEGLQTYAKSAILCNCNMQLQLSCCKVNIGRSMNKLIWQTYSKFAIFCNYNMHLQL